MKRVDTPCTTWLVALLLVSPLAHATPICRWVDKTGRTQVAQVVPEQYRAAATCTDSRSFELTAAQRRAAEQRGDEDRATASAEAARQAAAAASSPPRPADPAPRPVVKRPAQVVTDDTDCPTWWRLYDESTDCFGPYRTTRGATRVESFAVCNVVPSPEPKCGPRTD